jgi:hypothetical protein
VDSVAVVTQKKVPVRTGATPPMLRAPAVARATDGAALTPRGFHNAG